MRYRIQYWYEQQKRGGGGGGGGGGSRRHNQQYFYSTFDFMFVMVNDLMSTYHQE